MAELLFCSLLVSVHTDGSWITYTGRPGLTLERAVGYPKLIRAAHESMDPRTK